MIDESKYQELLNEIQGKASLVAVSKFKPSADIEALYHLGQRDFGENYVQELVGKATSLPSDIRWHFIGHLQSNKVKYIAPFVYLIHGVDSIRLLKEINKQALKNHRVIPILLQIHIASEESKFGLDEEEWQEIMEQVTLNPSDFAGVQIKGLMGMASFSPDQQVVAAEFKQLQDLFNRTQAALSPQHAVDVLSMGMSNDYQLAIDNGSNMIRIGSLIFGARS